MKTYVSYYQNKKDFRVSVSDSFQNLIKLKKEGEKDSFDKLLLNIIPKIRKYINGKLNTLVNQGDFCKDKFEADDFIDQLFIEIYDNIEEVENENSFYFWIFKKINYLLEDVAVKEEFDNLFFKNIDDYSKPEWDEMQEEFSTDADGDLLMIDELDDISYNHNDYELNHVFVENTENLIIEKIDKTLSKRNSEKTYRYINS
jgi:hypothetical protein